MTFDGVVRPCPSSWLPVDRVEILEDPCDQLILAQLLTQHDVPADPQHVAVSRPGADLGHLDSRQLTDAPDRHALPGVQTKASATMLTSPLATTRERALLKIDPPQYPYLVANETLHLGAARRLKIAVAQHRVVRDVNTVPGLLVTRFDRVLAADGTVERLAMEDAISAPPLRRMRLRGTLVA